MSKQLELTNNMSDKEIMLYLLDRLPNDYIMCLTSYKEFYETVKANNFSKAAIEKAVNGYLYKLACNWYEWNDDCPRLINKSYLWHLFPIEQVCRAVEEIYDYYKEERK